MSRNTLLVAGAIAWTLAAIDALLHLVNGDLVVPIGMVLVAAVWIALRSHTFNARRSAEITVEA